MSRACLEKMKREVARLKKAAAKGPSVSPECLASRLSLKDFTTYTKPDYDINWHHEVMFSYLERFISGDIKRLMVFCPPRSGKSEIVSRRLPAYLLGRNPDEQIIACSFDCGLSSDMNRDVQRIIDSPEYIRSFPVTKLFGKNIRTVAHGSWLRNSSLFEVVGHKGAYRSAGVGSGITGRGFSYGIIDDPVSGAVQANSVAFRERLWKWYCSDFLTRQGPNARILVTNTRWHMDDLSGRLLAKAAEDPKADQWTVIKFPAICEPEKMPEDIRQVGEALWPKRPPLNLEGLEKIRANGAYTFSALYQQRPTPREGGMFQAVWFNQVVSAAPRDAVRVRYWDRGATETGDFTVGLLMAQKNGIIYVEDVHRGQWRPHARNEQMIAVAHADRAKYGDYEPIIYVEKEGGSAGTDQVVHTAQFFAGFPIHSDSVSGKGNKELRAENFAGQCEAGNVRLVRGAWNGQFVEELCLFPNGKNDDCVDGASGAYNRLFPRAAREITGPVAYNEPPSDRYHEDDELTPAEEVEAQGEKQWWQD